MGQNEPPITYQDVCLGAKTALVKRKLPAIRMQVKIPSYETILLGFRESPNRTRFIPLGYDEHVSFSFVGSAEDKGQ